MNSLFKLLSIAAVVSFALLIGQGSALAQVDSKCVDKSNNSLGKVGKAQAKENTACVKNATKGKESDPEGCLSADAKGKVAKAQSKVTDCSGDIPITAAVANAAFEDEARELAHDLFGPNLNAVGLTTASKDDGACATTVIQKAGDILAEKGKAFRSCKKDGMKLGTITNPATLEAACMTPTIPDPKGKIAKRITKLGEGIAKKCAATGGGTSLLNGGQCAGQTGNNLRDCADAWAECRICAALNAADGMARDCNAFAGIDCGGAAAIGEHKCVLSPASTLTIITQALPLPPFAASGAMDINCGVIGPDGKASCECILQDFDPIEIIGIGYICFTPATGCDPGEIDCDGGNALDIAMDTDHNLGACTGNADCSGQCTAYCNGLGGDVFNDGCEGFCQGGTNADNPCTADSDCPDGSCAGKDGATHGNICNCDCVITGGSPGGSGALQCNMGTIIDVENAPPCGDGDILIAVGTRCIPLTTQTVTSQIHNTNNNPGKDFPTPLPFTATGSTVACSTIATSTVTGLTLVGSANFIDSTIGDLNTQQVFTCQ